MRQFLENPADTALAALILALFVALGFTSLSAVAEDTSGGGQQQLHQIVDVREIRGDPDQVSGVLVNLSGKAVRSVRLQIDRAWLWADE